jgi:hypothetical protein
MAVKAKGKVKAKAKKKDVITPVVSEKRIRQALDEQAESAEKKFKYAKKILDVNKPELNEIAEGIVETLGRQAPNRLKIDGISVLGHEDELRAINRKLHWWIAVRLLVAAAEWDIRISGFKLPKSKCARCGKKVKS